MTKQSSYCISLSTKINDLSILKTKYEEKLDQASDDFEYRRDIELYKDIKSNLKYKHTLYKNNCIGYILAI